MMNEGSSEELQAESAAIKELRARLEEVEAELSELEGQRKLTERAIGAKRRERDALWLSIGSLRGETEAMEEPEGPRIEVRYRSGDRPTIRVIARERAEEAGGTLKIRDLLRETRRLGFKSDQGGLHTYLKGLKEFFQSGPGEFTLRIDAQESVEGGQEPGDEKEEML